MMSHYQNRWRYLDRLTTHHRTQQHIQVLHRIPKTQHPRTVDVKPCCGNDGVEEQTDVVVVASVVEMVLEVVIGEQTYVD